MAGSVTEVQSHDGGWGGRSWYRSAQKCNGEQYERVQEMEMQKVGTEVYWGHGFMVAMKYSGAWESNRKINQPVCEWVMARSIIILE